MKFPGAEALEPYLSRWRALQPRERLLVSVAAVVAGVFLFYLLLWVPMNAELARLRASVPKDQERLARMRAQAMEVNQLRASGAAMQTGANILSVIEQTATSRGFKQNITRMEPDGSHGANLTLDGVDFNTLVTWLAELQRQNGVRVESLTLEALAGPGLVKGRVALRGPTA